MSSTPAQQASALTRPVLTDGQLFIGGHWTEAADGARLHVIDPSTGQVVTTVADAGAADADAAVTAARAAFDSGEWSQPFDTEEEAIALANSTPYGLAAGLHTTNLARAHRVAAALQAGIVWVNDWAMLDPSMPFGGVKSSGFGREYGPEGLEPYTRSKSVIISLA